MQVFSTQSGVYFSIEPASFHEALRRPDADKWIEAMISEIKSIISNKTWTLCDLPPGRKCIGTKWVFKIKLDGNNNVERYKCRIVAKGYSQIAGLDFDQTFAPVVRIESVRSLLALAAYHGLHMLHIDCKMAFLNGQSDIELYVEQPEGFVDERYPNKVLRLNKSLYGLKQAPRIWYLLLCSVIISLGFTALESDPSIYINLITDVIIAVYVDDILVLSPNEKLSTEVYNGLAKHFKVENKGPPTTFLGLNIIRNARYLAINQSGYIRRMLDRFKMNNAYTTETPMDASLPLLKAQPHDKLANVQEYQELVGSLNHAAIFSRPDISFAVSQLSQFLTKPTATHMAAARRVLRYLKGTITLSIIYQFHFPSNIDIFGFTDASWAGDKNDRKSVTGYLFMIAGGLVSWTSHKQSTVAHSTMEAEYMGLSDASREAIARFHLYHELNIKIPAPLIVSDNQGALAIAENPTNYQRAKHIDLRYHFIRHALENGQIRIDYLPTSQQPADALTKALGPQKFHHLLDLMCLRKFGLDFVLNH